MSELAAQLADAYDAAREDGASDAQALRDVEAAILDDEASWGHLNTYLGGQLAPVAPVPGNSETFAGIVDACRRHGRHALRQLRRDRHFAVAVAVSLALCMGVSAAVFTVVNAVLLRPLPFAQPDRVVLMAYQTGGSTSEIRSDIPSYFDRLERLTVFEEMAMFRWIDVVVQTPAGAQRVRGDIATASLLELLGVAPLHGRLLQEPDGTAASKRQIVLSHDLWQELFAGDPAAIGHALSVNGEPFIVVGVMPPRFAVFRLDARFWIPATYTATERADARRGAINQYQIGRLRADVTIDDARRELAAFDRSEAERFPWLRAQRDVSGHRTSVDRLHDVMTREVRPTLALLLIGAGIVLLLGLLNGGMLALARSRRNLGELATRRILGERWGTTAAHLLAQSAIVAAAGTVGGLLVAAGLLALLRRIGLEGIPRAEGLGLEGATIGASAAAAVLAAVVLAIAPLAASALTPLVEGLHGAARDRVTVARRRYVGRGMVACQVAAAFVLTTMMVLIFVSVRNVTSIHPGFTSQGLTTASFDVPRALFAERAEAHGIVVRVLEEVRRIPGVESAGVTQLLPFGGRTAGWRVRAPEQRPEQAPLAWNYVVSPDYLETMQVPLVAGRYLDDRDRAGSERVMVISRRLAERVWPKSSAVGRHVIVDSLMPAGRFTVVGVVENVRQATLAEPQGTRGAIYRPFLQADERSYTLAVRTGRRAIDATALAAAVRTVDPRLAAYDARTMPERLDASIAPRRLALVNAAAFAGVALLLATAGLYAVLTYFVAGRRREFGIRLALGSSPRGLAAVVTAESLWVTSAGLLIGCVVMRFVRPLLDPHLHGVAAWETPVLLGAAVVIAAVAVLASFGPARRAATTDPLLVLRA